MNGGYQYIKVEQDERVVTITFQREAKLNAMNSIMMSELTDCFQKLDEQTDVLAIILTGCGKAFMAGADIEEYSGFDLGAFFAFQNKGRQMYRAIEECSKPVIAAVNGYALGGGFEMVLACDLVIASDKAKFGLPEINLGLVPGGGGVQKALRAVGPYVAKEMLMTGRFLLAEEARELRIVNRVAAPEQLLDAAVAMAKDIAGKAPLAVQGLKKLVNEGRDASLESAQAYDRAYLANLFYSADAKEGISAFVEKRPPVFKGK
ncbi:enoyl-CoA hydratase/isomerase family protein [Paenibacillus dokdonensis]|uniref:Enoyl-CoA hydratase/isomerase family protein n=1 Tax=Paenibacillus dokdonensis TaxID=2567944 RepID=A0ABU6GSZ3_9BACL|nr:enoyl-CoA hydratase/isomerase family protein [Paenibacillus dokdonensis]MEC0242882.1 enoyl-CoA hydratase/isomerase family protein [Paenibacillus dokdonensis]